MNYEDKIQIRRARSHEAHVLTNIALRAKQSNGYDDLFMDACKDELSVKASHMKENEYWVAELCTVCGFVCLADGPEPRVGELRALFIEPDWQRCGVGRCLWLKIRQRAESKGIEKVQVDADPASVAFYESNGFDITENVPSGSINGRFIPRMEIQIGLY
ncbi:MAG: N-acetylglutamate synthase-like GNAT family acetyltransferase [Candidatus Azotimanducaceae bacterium]|jgi:N-acetylglutamate synthase-like GNAT family acetyltransferase